MKFVMRQIFNVFPILLKKPNDFFTKICENFCINDKCIDKDNTHNYSRMYCKFVNLNIKKIQTYL